MLNFQRPWNASAGWCTLTLPRTAETPPPPTSSSTASAQSPPSWRHLWPSKRNRCSSKHWLPHLPTCVSFFQVLWSQDSVYDTSPWRLSGQKYVSSYYYDYHNCYVSLSGSLRPHYMTKTGRPANSNIFESFASELCWFDNLPDWPTRQLEALRICSAIFVEASWLLNMTQCDI